MMIATDSDTGRVLSPDEAQEAADNPYIYRWVTFTHTT